uniref:Uncharacterized protein n=1 Tax=Romanomermis culicivorax TaxID=13658 RepID=A0A915JAE7_ROMCU
MLIVAAEISGMFFGTLIKSSLFRTMCVLQNPNPGWEGINQSPGDKSRTSSPVSKTWTTPSLPQTAGNSGLMAFRSLIRNTLMGLPYSEYSKHLDVIDRNPVDPEIFDALKIDS